MNIYLDSLPITVQPDGVRIRYEPRGEVERVYDRTLKSSVTSTTTWDRVWEITTTEELAADIEAIKAVLEGPSAVSFSGDLVASGPLLLYPRNVVRRVARNAQYATLSFEFWQEAVVGSERKELIRVRVADASDTLQDLTAWFIRATVTAHVEAFAKTAEITFWRETDGESIAPGMASPNPVAQGRRVRIDRAILDLDEAVEEADWEPLFVGRIDDVEWGGKSPRIVCPCRDGAGILHDAWLRDEFAYGDDVSPVAIQTEMQRLMTERFGSYAPTLRTLGDPDFGVYADTMDRQSVQDGLFYFRDLVGWDLRYLWNASDGENQLTLYQPDRDKTVPDHTFSRADYFEVTGVNLSSLTVRNQVILDWDVDEDVLIAEDSTSIAEYANEDFDGVYTIFLDEAQNPHINTLARAQAYAALVLAETAHPALSHRARNAFAPEIEIGDLCRYAANGVHYSTDQDLAVVGYTHEIGPEGNSTSIDARGAPSGSVTRWYKKHKDAQTKQKTETDTADPPTLADKIAWFYTTNTGPGYSVGSIAGNSLGGWCSKTEVSTSLYGLFRDLVDDGQSSGGYTIYRSVFLANVDPRPSPEDLECAIGFLSPDEGLSGFYTWAVAADPTGIVAITSAIQQGARSPSEESPPDASPALSWISPVEGGSPLLDLGTISPGYGIMIHLRLTIPPGAAGKLTSESLVVQAPTPTG